MSRKRLAVIGLGLIGGSLAMGLRGFENWEIVGVDTDAETLRFAAGCGAGDALSDSAEAVLSDADVVFLCLHPDGILDFLRRYAPLFKPGALVADVCGVKGAVMETAAAVLPDGVDFIGCHPMAGKESSGIQNAQGDLFRGAHFILTPHETSLPAHVAFLERLSSYLGCRDVVVTTPEEHDAVIAYTSQVMHIMAVAVCDDPDLFRCKGFEGGSFRDCTRVAALDVPLWTQLFLHNAPALSAVIARLEENLRTYRAAIESGDAAHLAEKLAHSAGRKRKMNLDE